MNCEKEKKQEEQKEVFDLFALPMTAQYRLFQFSGLADDSILMSNIDPQDIAGRLLIIKGVKIVPYNDVATQDLFLTDGVTTNEEIIPALARINRVFDLYDYGCQLDILINGGVSPLFPQENVLIVPPAADGNVPLDLDVDNIFYKYPARLTSLDVRLDARSFTSLSGSVVSAPRVKVFIQCYLV